MTSQSVSPRSIHLRPLDTLQRTSPEIGNDPSNFPHLCWKSASRTVSRGAGTPARTWKRTKPRCQLCWKGLQTRHSNTKFRSTEGGLRKTLSDLPSAVFSSQLNIKVRKHSLNTLTMGWELSKIHKGRRKSSEIRTCLRKSQRVYNKELSTLVCLSQEQ